jgi:hypothetical protein
MNASCLLLQAFMESFVTARHFYKSKATKHVTPAMVLCNAGLLHVPRYLGRYLPGTACSPRGQELSMLKPS